MEINREMLLQSFREETGECLEQMEQSLLALETRPEDRELVSSLFRAAHTAKGNASLLEFNVLARFLHNVEDLLELCRSNTIDLSQDVINILLQSVDALRQMTKQAVEGAETLSPEHEALSARLAGMIAEFKTPQRAVAPENSASGNPEAPSPTAVSKSSVQNLRVDVGKLDRMLNLTVEFAIAQGRQRRMLEEKIGLIANGRELLDSHHGLEALFLELQELVMKIRMVPVGPTFHRFARSVRDTARKSGKLARMLIVGEDVEVDTTVLEHIYDPLMHMIRNSVDHGLESPEVRRSLGKDPSGKIVLKAFHDSGNIVIQISDDGAGLDHDRIQQHARSKGLIPEGARLTASEIQNLIFQPGFSTADKVSELSGRGVGLDVVRRNVQALRGSVQVSSQHGAGTTVDIRLPLTLAIIEGFSVGVGNETYVIPVEQVVECVELPAEENNAARTEGILQLRNQPLPFIYLRDHFELPGDRTGRQNIVVVQHGASRAGLAVDVLYGTTQTVIKPLPAVFKAIPGVSGSAIVGNGRVALILDVPALLRDFRAQEVQLV